MNGVLIVNKPQGFTSFDVCAKLRGILHTKKIGHTGTLDPNVEGVLPILVGNATKAASLIEDTDKVYRAKMKFGIATDTEDIWGNVTEEKAFSKTEEEVFTALNAFVGHYDQIPPMYSAKKINGEKLLDLARRGITVERKPVPVEIYGISDIEMNLPEVSFTVSCSKGTYIRTLCTDIAKSLGEIATMQALKRVSHGGFSLEDAYSFDEIENAVKSGQIDAILRPVDSLFPRFPKVSVKEEYLSRLDNGNKLDASMIEGLQEGCKTVRVYDSEGVFRALYEATKTEYKPVKMFGRNDLT